MTSMTRTPSVLGAALVGLLVSGGFSVVWWAVVERPVCEETGVFACSGPAISMYLLGVPLAYVVWSLGLRLARVALPWLVPLAVLGALTVLVSLAEVVEPPLAVWPVVAALLCGAWARVVPTSPQRERR